MGVILQQLVKRKSKRKLLPRYGGYSGRVKQARNIKTVVSPLWGLFSVNMKVSKSARELFPRYGGYSEAESDSITNFWLFPRYGGYSHVFYQC